MTRWMPEPDLHKCAVPTCTRQISFTYLMCREHWRMVDPATADGLYFARASFTHAPSAALGRKASGRMDGFLKQALAQVEAAAKPDATPPSNP